MAAEMQPRTQLYALAEVFANLALQTLGTPAIHHKYEFPGIGQETKASQRELLPLDCGVHEKSTRACPMMSMLPTTLFFEFTSWRHFLCWEILSSREHSFHNRHEERLRKCPKPLKRTYKIQPQNLNTKSLHQKDPTKSSPLDPAQRIRSATGKS